MQRNGTERTAPVRVAVDAMGGDFAPVETVKGAVQALGEENAELILVGDPEAVQRELDKHDVAGRKVSIVPSDGKIGDDEHPVRAMRSKPRASVVVATQLVKQDQADVIVSMGSTGAAPCLSEISWPSGCRSWRYIAGTFVGE